MFSQSIVLRVRLLPGFLWGHRKLTSIVGMVGLFFNALFGADYIIGLDGVNTDQINGGWLNHNYRQLYVQLAYIVACTAYSFVTTAFISFGLNFMGNFVPGIKLRASEKAELLGMDDDQLGEFAYDYVEVRRDYLAWTPMRSDHNAESPVAGKNLNLEILVFELISK